MTRLGTMLNSEDDEPFSSCSEQRWKTRFRWALKHLRDEDRIKYSGTWRADANPLRIAPLELLTGEVEVREDGETRVRYL